MVQGYLDKVEVDREWFRSIIYGAARFNGAGIASAFSKDAGRSIERTVFPWEGPQKTEQDDIASWILSWKNRN